MFSPVPAVAAGCTSSPPRRLPSRCRPSSLTPAARSAPSRPAPPHPRPLHSRRPRLPVPLPTSPPARALAPGAAPLRPLLDHDPTAPRNHSRAEDDGHAHLESSSDQAMPGLRPGLARRSHPDQRVPAPPPAPEEARHAPEGAFEFLMRSRPCRCPSGFTAMKHCSTTMARPKRVKSAGACLSAQTRAESVRGSNRTIVLCCNLVLFASSSGAGLPSRTPETSTDVPAGRGKSRLIGSSLLGSAANALPAPDRKSVGSRTRPRRQRAPPKGHRPCSGRPTSVVGRRPRGNKDELPRNKLLARVTRVIYG